MKKFGLVVAAVVLTVAIFTGCGQVERKEDSSNSSIIEREVTMEEKTIEDSSSKKEESSSKKEESSSKKEESSSKKDESSSKIIVELNSDNSKNFRESDSSNGSSDSIVTTSSSNNSPVLVEEVKPEMGPPPVVDMEPTRNEDTERMVGSIGPQLPEKVVFKPSTHYLHKSTCHWVNDECYEVTNTNDIEARICTECNPNVKVVNEYKEPEPEPVVSSSTYWDGPVLNPNAGVVYGPSGKETYYNLDMSGVISIMRGMGFDSVNYPYWVRSDGCKMLGDYIMVAACLDLHPRGTLVECSLGTALVCDTGGFAYSNPTQLDVAVTW